MICIWQGRAEAWNRTVEDAWVCECLGLAGMAGWGERERVGDDDDLMEQRQTRPTPNRRLPWAHPGSLTSHSFLSSGSKSI